jgi:opacity protein-like surface antigen
MNIKSLLVGSAALATVSTGAHAADAIVMADPEPMEYVRICDVYGAGFFYIPGTETCLKIGGYYRYQINVGAAGFTKAARFAPTFDVRSDSEIGTIRGYAEVEITWQRNNRVNPATGAIGLAYGTDINLLHGFVELIRPNGGAWRFGVSETPWSRFLGYGGPTINDGYYGYAQSGEISYTFTGSNGFSFIAALVEAQAGTFTPDPELGFKFTQGWGEIGLMAGYDTINSAFGAKGLLQFNLGKGGSFIKIMPMYTSVAASVFGFNNTGTFSVLAGLKAQFTPKVALDLTAQWVDTGQLAASIGMTIQPATDFYIRPEVTWDQIGGGGAVTGIVRLERRFVY